MREWLKQNPADFQARLYLAEAYLKSSDHRKAIDEYEYLQTKLPENLIVLNNLAWSYQQVKDKRAVETAEKALKLDSENPAVMDTLGLILAEYGDLPRGAALLKK